MLIVVGNEEKVRSETEEQKPQSIVAPDAKILVVDDNEFNLRVTCGMLGLSKINAATASSGKQAIEMIAQNDYDIVFMNHMMPEMDGVEATDIIRKLGGKYEKLVIVASTANAVFGAKEMFLANGFDAFISKPINIGELGEILKEWLPPHIIGYAGEGANEVPIAPKEDFLSALAKIKEINYELALSRVEGDEEIYHITVELFYNNILPECSNMTALIEDTTNIKDFGVSVVFD